MKTKLCKPILIDDEENIYKDELSLFDDKLIINSKLKSSSDTKQIVVVSLDKDDKIKSGDLITIGNRIIIAPNTDRFIGFRKVIATQDQLSPEYIQQFIEEYNNDNVKDIEIAMNEVTIQESSSKYENNDILVNGDIVNSINYTLTEVIDKTVEKYNKPKLTNGFITIIEYPIGGYAPGNYTCNCITCKKQFVGDKRAVQCIDCATKIETPIVFTEKELLFIVELVGGNVAKAIDYIKTINKQ